MSNLDEHAAFQRMIDGMDLAIDGAMLLSRHQPDKAHLWQKAAASMQVTKEILFSVAEDRAVEQSIIYSGKR
jgi:hypothetical protein